MLPRIPDLKSMENCMNLGGLLVKPEAGKVVLFYNLLANGETNRHSLHGSCPVQGDEIKWAANKWIWNTPYLNL